MFPLAFITLTEWVKQAGITALIFSSFTLRHTSILQVDAVDVSEKSDDTSVAVNTNTYK